MENNKKLTNRRQEREEAFTLVFERMFKDDDSEEVFDSAVEARDASIGEFTKLLTMVFMIILRLLMSLLRKISRAGARAEFLELYLHL